MPKYTPSRQKDGHLLRFSSRLESIQYIVTLHNGIMPDYARVRLVIYYGEVCCRCCWCSWCCCCRCCWCCCCLSRGCCQRQHNHRRVLLTLLADNWQTKNTAYRTHNNPGAQFAPCHVNETVETNATDPRPKRPPLSQPYKKPTHCQLSCGLNFISVFPFFFYSLSA